MTTQLDEEKKRYLEKQLKNIIEKLKMSNIAVEGKKDVEALKRLGCNNIICVAGNPKIMCKTMNKMKWKNVVILTDIDERGNELADEVRKELERYEIAVDVETRKRVSKILNLKEVETIDRKYEKILKDVL